MKTSMLQSGLKKIVFPKFLLLMDALTALHTRNSVNLLTEPGPTPVQLENLIKAGLRACDHKSLKPWKFLLIEGDARLAFGKLMAKVKKQENGGLIDPLSLIHI